MSHGHAECTTCGHTWELRKPHTEIDRLRCSDCGTTGEAITVTATPTTPVDPDELSLVARLQREERQTAIRIRAQRLMTQIEQLGTDSVPTEFEPVYTALETLTTSLTDETVTAANLDAIAAYLDDKEADINTHETATTVTDLEQHAADLRAEIEQLQADVEELEDEKARLKQFLTYGDHIPDPD